MAPTRRFYLWMLGLNAAVVVLAAATALLLPAPRGWPDWVGLAWWLGAAAISLGVLAWRRRAQAEDDPAERRVAGLSLASLPLVWGLFAVLAFWAGFVADGFGLAFMALAFAVLGYVLQPAE